MAVNWANDHVPAILQAWYPGQHGDAVADILFGNYNPAGRLPVTFYKSVKDLPDFTDYAMSNRTYRYFTGPVLYPFGYGLSYSTFSYSNLQVASSVSTTEEMRVTVQVKNNGPMAGDEVAQLYVNNEKSGGATASGGPENPRPWPPPRCRPRRWSALTRVAAAQ